MNPDKRPAILVVDDEPVIVEVVKEFLAHFSANVQTASNSVDALAIAEKNPIDLIISDINMPKSTGIDLLKELRNRKINSPVIFITGHGAKELVKEAWELGAFDFLEKPLSREVLLRAVEAALAFGSFSNKGASKSSKGTLGFANKRVSELPFTPKVLCCPPTTPVTEVVQIMAKKNVGAIVITDTSDRVIGIFTERDLLIKIAGSGDTIPNKPISDFMTPSPKCVRTTSSVVASFSIMRMGRFRHLIVVDDENRCLGLLSIKDAFTYICDLATGLENS